MKEQEILQQVLEELQIYFDIICVYLPLAMVVVGVVALVDYTVQEYKHERERERIRNRISEYNRIRNREY